MSSKSELKDNDSKKKREKYGHTFHMARKSSKIIPSQCRRDKIITQVLLFDPRQVECCDIGLQVCRKDKKKMF